MRGIRFGMLMAAMTLCFYSTACSKKAEEAAPEAEVQTQEEPAEDALEGLPTQEAAPETETAESQDSENSES